MTTTTTTTTTTATSRSTADAPADAPAVAPPGRPLDWGRVVMVPVSVLFGTGAVVQTLGLLAGDDGGSTAGTASGVLGGALTAAFYALVLWAYLRRGPARATSRSLPALVAAPVATFLPFLLPFLGTGGTRAAATALGTALLVAGLAWSVWSIRTLDRCLSVVPQARQVVDHGPYALVRHPLYLGELVAVLGLALTLGGPLPLALWPVLVALQCFRAVQEERLLSGALDGYAAYRARTARVLPGLF